MFSHNGASGPESENHSLVFRRFRQVVALGVKSMYMFSACDHMQSRLMLLLYCHTCDGVSVNNVQ